MKNKNQLAIFIAVFAVFFLILLAAGINLYQKNQERVAWSGGDGNINISFDKQGLVPFDIMEIQGDNLDPDAATSVILTTYSKQTLVIPALSVRENRVEVPVPPLAYDQKSGKFGIDAVAFYVIQAKKTNEKLEVRTSNKISGISVMMPLVPEAVKAAGIKGLPAGLISRAFASHSLRQLDDFSGLIASENKTLSAPFGGSRPIMEEFLTGLENYIDGRKAGFELRALDGEAVAVTADDIAWLDAFYAAFLGQAEKQVLLAADGGHGALIPAASAAEPACNNNWQSESNPSKKIELELDCLYSRGVIKAGEKNKSEKLGDVMDSLSFSFLTEGMLLKNQINFALTRFFTGLNPQMISLIRPKPMPVQLHIIYLLGEILYESNKVCSTLPEFCYLRDYTLADPFNARDIIFMKYGTPQGEEARFQTPEDFENWLFDQNGLADGGYDVRLLPPEPEPLPKYDPIPKPKPVPAPAPAPSPAPVTPEPIVDIPPPPAPAPVPGKTCSQLRQESNTACRAGCTESSVCYTEYSECTPACNDVHDLIEKNWCVNNCLGTWKKCLDDSSKCYNDCIEADNAFECP